MNNLTKYTNWLETKNLSPNTIIAYQQVISKYYNYSFTTENISKFIKKLAKNKEPATCQLYLAALISYSKYLKDYENIEWDRIKSLIPKKMRKFFTTISEKELKLLKQARFEKNETIYQRNNLMLDFLFYSGIRVSELVNIKHRDYQEQSLRIHGKGNKIRQALLPPFLEKYLRPGAKGYLFTNQNGRKILTDKVREIIRIRTKLAGLKKWVSPHTFRRSFATLLDRRKVRMTTIQKLLGHSNLETTAAYIHNNYQTIYEDYSKLWKQPINQENICCHAN